jgi:hypothetical protein
MTDESNGNVRISVFFDRDVYEQIERISAKLGVGPATWVNIVTTSKLKEMIHGCQGARTRNRR